MSIRTLALPLVLLTGLTTPQAIYADDAPEKTIRYRHKVMDALGDHMGSTSLILKGEVSREKDLTIHAKAMNDLAKTLPELWPKGTLENSDSKKEVWEKWDDFLAACKTFETATAALVEATEKSDAAATQAAFKKVGGSCGGCHDTFRVDDN
jgi:cytochrome c556